MQGEKKVNYGDFLDEKGISQYLKRLYADIDIYTNKNITAYTVGEKTGGEKVVTDKAITNKAVTDKTIGDKK